MERVFHRLGLTLIGTFIMLASATLTSGDPAQGDGKTSPVPTANPYAVVNHVGEADQQATLKDAQLLGHRRTADPFAVGIRGKFKRVPPAAEHPSGADSSA